MYECIEPNPDPKSQMELALEEFASTFPDANNELKVGLDKINQAIINDPSIIRKLLKVLLMFVYY